MVAGSSPAMRCLAARRFSSTFHSYGVLRPGLDHRGMFSISPEHAIGLVAGSLSIPIALLALRRHRAWREAPGTVQAAAVLMMFTAAVHLALIGHHLKSAPVTSALFGVNGALFIALAFCTGWRRWRIASSLLLVATILGYLVYVVG